MRRINICLICFCATLCLLMVAVAILINVSPLGRIIDWLYAPPVKA